MDNIIEKLKKIKELAERGDAGEAIAAQEQLEKLIAKYHIKIEDLFDDTLKPRSFKVKRDENVIFTQVALSVIGNRAKKAYYYRDKPSVTYLELTDVEYIDITNLFDFHKKQLQKEKEKAVKTLLVAYVHKHDLFNIDSDDKPKESKMTFEEYLDIMAVKDRLEDVSFHKQLN